MNRVRILIPIAIVIVLGVVAWFWLTAGRESTDDAQTEAHVVQIAPRIGGTVLKVLVNDNQTVEAGATLVEIDPRDYQIAVEKARADVADAEASAKAAAANALVTATGATTGVMTAAGGVAQSRAAIEEAERGVEGARGQLEAARTQVRQAEANAT